MKRSKHRRSVETIHYITYTAVKWLKNHSVNQFIVIFTEGNFTLDLEHLCVRGLSAYCLLLVGACVYLAKVEKSPVFSCLQLPRRFDCDVLLLDEQFFWTSSCSFIYVCLKADNTTKRMNLSAEWMVSVERRSRKWQTRRGGWRKGHYCVHCWLQIFHFMYSSLLQPISSCSVWNMLKATFPFGQPLSKQKSKRIGLLFWKPDLCAWNGHFQDVNPQ